MITDAGQSNATLTTRTAEKAPTQCEEARRHPLPAMPRKLQAPCGLGQQPAKSAATTLPPTPAGRPGEDDLCTATSADVSGEGQNGPADLPALLPSDVEPLATPRCRAHAELLRQHWLLLSLHWAACGGDCRNDNCRRGTAAAAATDLWPFGHGSCSYGRGLWQHIRDCGGACCSNAMCLPTRQLTAHFCACRDEACPLCQPVRHALAALSAQPLRASRQVTAQRRKAEASPEVRLLRQLCAAVAAGEAALEAVAPTRYNLVRLVLEDMYRSAPGGSGGDSNFLHSPRMSAASSNTMCYS